MNDPFSKADNLSPDAGRARTVVPAEGYYPELVILEVPVLADKGGKSFYKAAFRVVSSETETPVGADIDFFETVSGSDYPDYDLKALARVKQFVGAANGLAGEECKREVTGDVIRLSRHESQPLRGHVVAGTVTYERDKQGKVKMGRAKAGREPTPFLRFSFSPVLVDGKPKTVSLGAYSPRAAAPAAPPPPPAAPAAPVLPEGWLAHPTAPGYMYRGQEVAKIPA